MAKAANSSLRSWVHLGAEAAAETGILRVEGWVFSDANEKSYQVRAVALAKSWPADTGILRPDVAAAFPAATSAGESGFRAELAVRPGAVFELVLEAKLAESGWQSFYRESIAIPRPVRPPFWRFASAVKRLARLGRKERHEPVHPGYLFWLDEPLDWQTLPPRFRVSGWCFSRTGEPVQAIRATVGGREFLGNYGFFRADVAASHGERPGTFKSGFDIDVAAPRGRAAFTIAVQHPDGEWQQVFARKISAPILNWRRVGDTQLWKLGDYRTWIRFYDTLRGSDKRDIRAHIARLPRHPLISIVMPVFNPSAHDLRSALRSVRAQLYPHWELCVSDDASTAPHVRRILRRYQKRDARIWVNFRRSNGGISAASNDALALVTGEFVALLDHDDALVPTALYFVALEINQHPEAQLIYSDEDKLSPGGRRTNAHFKPDWNAQLFLAQNYFSHLGVFRAELIKTLRFREGFEGSQDYDLVLRCVERVAPQQIRHIPRVLYHWRMARESAALNYGAKPHARAAAIRALEEFLEHREVAAEISSSGDEDFRRVRYLLPPAKPPVAIVMPTRDNLEMLRTCLESILRHTSYPAFEILLVDNASRDAGALRYLTEIAADPRVRVLRDEGDFHYGRLNNLGVRNVEAPYVALLNNDLVVTQADWLGEMVSQGIQPGIGAVGARLLYPDNRIQHAGVILGVGGVAAHAHKGLPRENHGYFARAILAQNFSAVTAACMLVKKSAYLESGGFDEENLRIAFNDVDLCLRLVRKGHRIVYTPYAELYHHESSSRGLEDTVAKNQRFAAEIKYMQETWGEELRHDPAYNPNLSLDGAGFTLAFPPRLSAPWRDKGKMSADEAELRTAAEYLFHLDAPPNRIMFSARLEITGWLFHREGKPIHGLRGVVKSWARAPRTFKARRKRARPAIGAAYPDLPEAAMSGFLLELDDLPLGPFDLKLEVRDHEKIWRTIFTTRAQAFPLDLLGRMRLPNLQRVLAAHLNQRFAGTSPHLALEAGELEEIKNRMARPETALAPVSIKTVRLFVTSKSNLFIVEIAELVCAGFRAAGFAAELSVDRIPEEVTRDDVLQIVVTPHEFYNLFFTPQLPWARIAELTRGLFLLGTEQPESDWFHSNLAIAPYARAMLDINPLGVAGYRARGLPCFHLPLGYHPMLERVPAGTKCFERDLDVCLLASMTERREKFLAENAAFFAGRNCHLRLVPLGFAKTKETKSYLPDEERNALLQRSKILLNVHYSDLRYFEWHRMLVGLANGCCIISETCVGFAPLVPGKHFVMAEPEQLAKCCEYYLEHRGERETIAQAGRNFIREHLSQADNCLQCVRQITSGADSSVAAQPHEGVAPQDSLAREIGGSAGKLLWRAWCTDLCNLFPSSAAPEAVAPPSATAPPSAAAPSSAATPRIETIRERRRGYAERFALQERAERSGEELFCVKDNNAFREKGAPAISVVITLYNYAPYIRQCVQSLNESSTAGIPGGIEILIVDDASTDRSLAQAQRAQRDSAWPLRIVAKKFNTGLADARNVGLRMARAPYAFIMDADNLVFPRALAQLYRAITAARCAAAYCILCRFQGQPANRSGLLSYYDWDARMLVEHPYIDAMALFDREKLIELGGYDNELFKIGWFGWEDYELWLRMAAAHLQAAFVPNILCLYRHHETSMSNTTNLFENDLVRHLIGRYQGLIDQYQPKRRVFGVEWSRLAPDDEDCAH